MYLPMALKNKKVMVFAHVNHLTIVLIIFLSYHYLYIKLMAKTYSLRSIKSLCVN